MNVSFAADQLISDEHNELFQLQSDSFVLTIALLKSVMSAVTVHMVSNNYYVTIGHVSFALAYAESRVLSVVWCLQRDQQLQPLGILVTF